MSGVLKEPLQMEPGIRPTCCDREPVPGRPLSDNGLCHDKMRSHRGCTAFTGQSKYLPRHNVPGDCAHWQKPQKVRQLKASRYWYAPIIHLDPSKAVILSSMPILCGRGHRSLGRSYHSSELSSVDLGLKIMFICILCGVHGMSLGDRYRNSNIQPSEL